MNEVVMSKGIQNLVVPHWRSAGTALLLTVALACGGGGGGSSSPTPAPSTSSVAGTAAKGIIRNGLVTAYERVAGAWSPIGTATTDANGAYVLTSTGYQGGLVKLTITAGAGTTMVWDGATGNGHTFGVAEALPSTFTMSTVLPALGANGSTSAPITPYTDLVDELVEASLATATASTVQNAISTVNVLTGFDVSTTPVVDVTNATAMAAASPTAQQAAAMNAAICMLVPGGAGGDDIARTEAKLKQSIAGGHFTTSSPIAISSLVSAWTSVLDNPEVGANLGSSARTNLLTSASTVSSAISNGTYTPVPPANVPTTQLAQAKTLISDTRSLVYNIASSTTAPVRALGLDLDANANLFDRDVAAMAEILGQGLEQMVTAASADTALMAGLKASGTGTKAITVQVGGQSLGTLTATASNPGSVTLDLGGTLTGIGANARSVTVAAHVDTGLDYTKVDQAAWTTTQTALTAAFTGSVTDGTNSIAITSGTLTLAASGSGSAFRVTSLALSNLGLAIQSRNDRFTGKAAIDFIQADPAFVSGYYQVPWGLFGVRKVALDGTFSVTDPVSGSASVATAAITLNLANSDTFDLMAYLNGGQEITFERQMVPLPADIVNALQAASKAAAATTSWYCWYGKRGDATWAESSGSAYLGGAWTRVNPSQSDDYSALEAAFDPASLFTSQIGALPAGTTRVGDSCNVNRDIGYGFASVTMRLPDYLETSSRFLKAVFTADFTAKGITGFPSQGLVVHAAVDRDQYLGGSASLNLSWGTKTYKIDVAATDVTQAANTINVTSPDGVVLSLHDVTLDLDHVTGTLKVGSAQVGTIATIHGGVLKITYADGTFETLE